MPLPKKTPQTNLHNKFGVSKLTGSGKKVLHPIFQTHSHAKFDEPRLTGSGENLLGPLKQEVTRYSLDTGHNLIQNLKTLG